MAVLHLISDTARRGAQVFATSLAAELESLGVEGSVVALAPGGTDADLDVPIIEPSWRARRAAMRSVDLVIAHGSTTLDAAALGAPGRFVYRSIGDPSFWLSTPARRIKNGIMLRTARRVVVLYPGAADAMHERAWVPRSRLRVIPNAVAPPARATATPELTGAAHHVLYVGALSWEKQVDHLIAAVARLDDTALVCVGDGPDRQALEELARQELGDRVLFVGAVADPAPYYAACDVLGVTSRTEGQPGCILEAALAGMPTCAYAVGGIPDMIDDGLSGRLVAPGSVDDMAAGIAWATEHRDEAGRYEQNHARERHLISHAAVEWRNVIAEVRGP